MARPVCKRCWNVADQSTPTYPVSGTSPRWRSARPDPHNSDGVEAPFPPPGFQNVDRLLGHLPFATRRYRDQLAPADLFGWRAISLCRCQNLGVEVLAAVQHGPELRASLLASATTAMLMCTRARKPRNHAPNGVSREESEGDAARAPWMRILRKYTFASFGNAQKPRLAAAGHLLRHETEPGGKVPPALECLAVSNRSDRCRRI